MSAATVIAQPEGLNAAGWTLMLLCIGMVTVLMVFCYYRILREPRPSEHHHAPLKIDTSEEAPIELVFSECPRPKTITVISWIEIVFAGVGLAILFGLAMYIKFRASGMPLIFAYAMAAVLQFTWGWGMLNGKNWARLLFLWLVPINVVIVLVAGEPNELTLLHFVRYIIFAVLLTRPNAVAYFTRTAPRA